MDGGRRVVGKRRVSVIDHTCKLHTHSALCGCGGRVVEILQYRVCACVHTRTYYILQVGCSNLPAYKGRLLLGGFLHFFHALAESLQRSAGIGNATRASLLKSALSLFVVAQLLVGECHIEVYLVIIKTCAQGTIAIDNGVQRIFLVVIAKCLAAKIDKLATLLYRSLLPTSSAT